VTLDLDTGGFIVLFSPHSRPVTADVLYGDKSQFQLSDDTVNTAAHMESTGMKDRIHLSQETAYLNIEGGKERWVISHLDLVVAKGKGEMKTFWLLPEDSSTATEYASELKSSKAKIEKANKTLKIAEDVVTTQTEASPQIMCLIDWNAHVLK
jgi:hypothetical protein